jgi:hypothetical protein
VKAKGEQSILYLIWHLFTRLSGTRRGVASSHIQKRITRRTLSLDGKRGSRATTFIRATGNAILLSSFCMRLFFFRLQSAEDVRERQSRFRHPMCQSKCPFKNLRSRKKRREDLKRGRRHFLRSLKLTLSLTLFPFIMVRVVVTIENRAAARIGWRTM